MKIVLFLFVFVLSINVTAYAAEFDSGKVLAWLGELKELQAKQDWAERLEKARYGVRQFHSPDDFRVDVLTITLDALSDYVDKYGANEKLDAEAKSYYSEAEKKSTKDTEPRARVDHMLGLYYSKSDRNGLALPYELRAQDYWEKSNDIEQMFVGYSGIAGLYGDMGQLKLERYYRKKALSFAKENFIIGFHPPAGQIWLTYLETIRSYMDDIAAKGKADELLELWNVAEPIYFAYGSFPSRGYSRLAFYLSLAGDAAKTEFYFKKAERETKREIAKHPHLAKQLKRDLLCDKALSELAFRRYQSAVREIKKCHDATLSLKMQPDMTLYTKYGIALEYSGELNKAIDAYQQAIKQTEALRSTYGIAERVTFFRTLSRVAYWGLIRCYAKRAAKKRDISDFYRALQSTELVRARQLGELIDPTTESSIAIEFIKQFQNGLTDSEVVLDYILTEQEIVILAFSRDKWLSRVMPYHRAELNDQIRQITTELATPTSAVREMQARLAQVSGLLLDPVASLLPGKKSIIALPDGEVNLVPFDLFLEPGTKDSLINSRTVRLSPSLRLIMKIRTKKSTAKPDTLYAVANPLYQSDYQIAGLSSSEMRSVLRDDQYLSYFTQLPETRTEVHSIAKLFPDKNVRIVLGKKAQESEIKRADLRNYQFIHIATHGILEGEVAGIAEPALVLSEEKGEDGFLAVSEAAELNLNADLTVLSACKTGSGEFITGEGIMGMGRAFLSAGSRNVLVSLWSVDSKMTELLMVKFYQHLRSGKEAASALRDAKLELIKDYSGSGQLTHDRVRSKVDTSKNRITRQLHPYYWAAFVLVGS